MCHNTVIWDAAKQWMTQFQLNEHHRTNDRMEQVVEENDEEILEYSLNAMAHSIQVLYNE